jgi:HSP20 family protein
MIPNGYARFSVMAFARWDPIRDLLAIQQRLDRFAPAPSGWIPPIDVHETADEYVITAELPGLGREDVEIQVLDGRLQISGQRRERDVPCEQYHRVERGHGSFSRTFELPHPVDDQRVTADLRDGVLTVICPKAAEGNARRIRVS